MRQRNITADAARLARAGSSNLASLKRALHAAEDNMSGLRRMLRAPNTTPRRATIKKTTTDGFAASATQIAKQVSNSFSLAQRIL